MTTSSLRCSLLTALAATVLGASSCQSLSNDVVEGRSLTGRDLVVPPPDEAILTKHEPHLSSALRRLELDPTDEEAWVWAGRRQAYLGRFQAAIQTYTAGIEAVGPSALLLRHRGHRHITLRQFEAAERDLNQAWELCRNTEDSLEQDGLPNSAGIPRSTLHTNVTYHLGLARYLQGNFEGALEAFEQCLADSPNDDMWVAAGYWIVLSSRRAGNLQRSEELLASVPANPELFENQDYYRLLQLFRRELTSKELVQAVADAEVGFATTLYGVSAHMVFGDRQDEARGLWQEITDKSPWPAFGHIAAEVELVRYRGE